MGEVVAGLRERGALDPVLFAARDSAVAGDPRGREQLPDVLREVRPDIVLVHDDASAYAIHRRAIEEYGDARVAVYCPIDWPEVVPGVPKSLADVDLVVTYTDYGDRVLERSFGDVGLSSPPRATIGHGVDGALFRPFAGGRTRVREELFADRPELRDAFIVLNANRNVARKRVDLTLRGFAAFARERADAYLYLHMGMSDRGCDVLALAAELGIAGRLLVTTRGARHPDVPDERLNLIYNACDVGLNTCEAEGWGLVAFEHAATGAPQVVPDGSACAELWRDAGVLVPATPTPPLGGHVVAPDDVATALASLYDDRELLGGSGSRAQAHVRAPEFGWGRIASEWEAVLL
jgi:glycosyltransferase involved in cell wall biosynthesis